VAYLLKFNPEDALRGTLARFERRFRHVENRLREQGKTPEQSNLQEMDGFWDEAKKFEKVQVWGLTGSAGSGKSTVAQFFSDHGIPHLDADQIARDLTLPQGAAHSQILARFGTSDRAKLRELVFRDPQAKQDLEKILHPLIQAEVHQRIQALGSQYPVVLYEAALLVETERYRDLAGLIVVDAPRETCLSRLLSRPGMTSEMAHLILDSQTSSALRNSRADFIIENTASLEHLRLKLRDFLFARGWIKN
jgi:dephospho-CoA kinase